MGFSFRHSCCDWSCTVWLASLHGNRRVLRSRRVKQPPSSKLKRLRTRGLWLRREEEQRQRQERKRAERASAISRARELANHSIAAREDAPVKSLLLAVEALNATSTIDETNVTIRVASAEQALRDVLGVTNGIPLLGHTATIRDAVFSPDGRWLATASEDAMADSGTFKIRWYHRPFCPPIVQPVTDALFSSDGVLLITASVDRIVNLWRLDDLTVKPTRLEHDGQIEDVRFGLNGTTIIVVSTESTRLG